MKVTVEFDCTPEEARQFLGLPDVHPLQAAVMAKVEQRMLDAADAFRIDVMLKNWFGLLPKGPEQFQEMFGRLFRAASPPGKLETPERNAARL